MVSELGVSLRSATAEDRSFLVGLYASTRVDELAPLGWDAATMQAFCAMQFDLQDRAYRQAHPDGSFDVVLIAGEPAGRLYVDRRADAIDVVDIALLPEHRGRGIGTALLGGVLDEGRRRGARVRIQALRDGDAVRLYRRLGFEIVAEDEVYVALEAS